MAGIAALAVVGGATTASAADNPVGCGYATSGPAASTLCWLDMSAYNDTAASSTAGQNMTVTLPGGYTMTFNVIKRPVGSNPSVAFASRPATGRPLGDQLYPGLPGNAALANTAAASFSNTVTLRNIVVRDSAGAQVSGYAIASGDAEITADTERITWTSNAPITQLGSVAAANGCQASTATGFGTTTVSCTGTGLSAPYGTLAVKSVGATTFSARLDSTTGVEAVAFAVQTAKVTLNKQVVDRRLPADSFDLAVTSPEGTTVGTATTGGADTATTGPLTAMPRTAGQSFTLSEAASAGSSLANYDQSWSCTNATAGSTTSLPTGTGTSVAVSPQPGDDISCTVTNTAKQTDLSIVKAGPATAGVGEPVTYTLIVSNNGPGDSTGYTVTDQLPAGLTGVTTSTPGCTVTGQALTCTGGPLAFNERAVITVSGVADGSVQTLFNTAAVKSNEVDGNPGNDTSNEVTTEVVPLVSVAVGGGALALLGGGYALRRRPKTTA
ncbi:MULTISPECIES: DUF11 domain-containing protein [Amycolatopsis]|uniref:DUF11 domain-containing protein n=1 Tax=Amycolatopsis TaxID=1813 RepID=UPI001FE4B972|nr:DUF11 domain-containing protein [Amycolatopsis sacchari]